MDRERNGKRTSEREIKGEKEKESDRGSEKEMRDMP